MEKTVKQNKGALESLLIGLKLLLICAIVAGVVSFVYSLTEAQYEKNIQATKNAAIGEIFGLDAPTCKEIAKGDATVYTVYDGETLIGYCVESASAGFGGDVALMVGYGADRSLLGVSVIAHSETPGLGAKVAEAAFLDQYKGQSGTLMLGEDVDAVSGETISSRAVTNAVNLATEVLEMALSLNGGEGQ